MQWRYVNHLAPPAEIFGVPTKNLVAKKKDRQKTAHGQKLCPVGLISLPLGQIYVPGAIILACGRKMTKPTPPLYAFCAPYRLFGAPGACCTPNIFFASTER